MENPKFDWSKNRHVHGEWFGGVHYRGKYRVVTVRRDARGWHGHRTGFHSTRDDAARQALLEAI